jgi:hypothetical protein
MNEFRVQNLADGKYSIIRDAAGQLTAYRYGEEWRKQDLIGDHLIAALVHRIEDHEEADRDRRRLVRQLDVALYGEANAAPQAALCDVVSFVEAEARKFHCPVLMYANRVFQDHTPPRQMDGDFIHGGGTAAVFPTLSKVYQARVKFPHHTGSWVDVSETDYAFRQKSSSYQTRIIYAEKES